MTFESIKTRGKPSKKEDELKYTPGEGVRFTDLLKKAVDNADIKYTPGKGINFKDILKTKEEAKTKPLEVPKEIHYIPGRGINFKEVYDKEEFREKTFFEKHNFLLRKSRLALDIAGITKEGKLTKIGIMKILALLILPGTTELLAAHQAFLWMLSKKKSAT